MKNKETALLLIDVQQAFTDEAYWGGNRNNPQAEHHMSQLLSSWRSAGLPVLHVKHNSTSPTSPLRPAHPGNQVMAFAQPQGEEPLFEKQVNSAFIGTGLQAYLEQQQISSLVLAGFITDHCVSTTARMAANLGFEVYVAADATATFNRIGPDGADVDAADIHRISLVSLHREFATILPTEDLLLLAQKSSHANL